MNAVPNFTVSPATALTLDSATIAALSRHDYADYQVAAVTGWHEAFGQTVKPELQFNLIREEVMEVTAAGIEMSSNYNAQTTANFLKEQADFEFVLAGAALIDHSSLSNTESLKLAVSMVQLGVLTDGLIRAYQTTAAECGWNIAVFEEVRREAFRLVVESNMSKLDDEGKPIFAENGKILKGPNFKAPDLSALAQRLMETANPSGIVN